MATAGPTPISSGATPTTVDPTYLPMMEEERPRDVAVERRPRSIAEAPSDTCEELPAVKVPVALKTVLSLPRMATEVSWRIPSSWVIRTALPGGEVGLASVPPPPSRGEVATVRGMICESKRPSFWALRAL